MDSNQDFQTEHQHTTRKEQGIIWGCIVLVAVVAAALFALNSQEAKNPPVAATRVIKIGLMAPLTGDNVQIGTSARQSIRLALQEFNEEGVTVQVIEKDTKCDPSEALSAVRELIDKDKVIAIVGDYCSSATLEAAKYAEAEKIPLVSPASSNPNITKAGDYIFRTIPSDTLQGKYLADLIKEKGLKRLAIAYGNDAYGVGLKDSLKQSFSGDGVIVVAEEKFENETADLKAQVTRIKAANPTALFVVSSSNTSIVAVLLAAEQLMPAVALFGSEALKSDIILNDAAEAAEGITVSAVSEGTSSFADKYRAAYQVLPSNYAAQTYDAARALTLTFSNGARSGVEVKNNLYSVKFSGATGPIEFDKNGDVAGNYRTYRVLDGIFGAGN